MATSIEKNMNIVLGCIYTLDETAGGSAEITGDLINKETGLWAYAINDAVKLLSQGGLTEVTTAMETLPYDFYSVRITPKGKLKFQKTSIPQQRESATSVGDPRTVFVVHGRNEVARIAIFTFLRSIGLHPLEWSEAVVATGMGAPYIGDVLDAAFSKAQAVIVLMTRDDEGRLREPFRKSEDAKHEVELTPQARLNVLFEAGMAMGRFPDRTIIVELGNLRPFSDIGGRHAIKFDNSTEKRQELAQRLETAGCTINIKGTDWHTAGDFRSVYE